MTRKRLRAVLHHRVSTRRQDAAAARTDLRRAAAAYAYEVVGVIEEVGSGKNPNLPGVGRVMEMARRREVDVVMVWRLCRFGRSFIEMLAKLRELRELGIILHAIGDGITLRRDSDPTTELVFRVLAAVGEWNREIIVENTLQGLRRARELGHRIGRPPLAARPNAGDVALLRAAGLSWDETAATLETNVSQCRRASSSSGQRPVSSATPQTARPNRPPAARSSSSPARRGRA